MNVSRSRLLAPHLPFLRRYARALTGSQTSGDAYVRATLQAIIDTPEALDDDVSPRVGLYGLFHAMWSVAAEGTDPRGGGDRLEQVARERLSTVPPRSRQALLLTAMEGFSEADAATIMGADPAEIAGLVAAAVAEIERQTRTDVLVIEDEPLIAMELARIVEDLGHGVAAVARTRSEAVAAAERSRPGLVLADIQLADGSSGIDAVRDILGSFTVPVIFITAFPERLLTGDRPEPTFLLTKPFDPRTVKAAISQALFFRSTASMAA